MCGATQSWQVFFFIMKYNAIFCRLSKNLRKNETFDSVTECRTVASSNVTNCLWLWNLLYKIFFIFTDRTGKWCFQKRVSFCPGGRVCMTSLPVWYHVPSWGGLLSGPMLLPRGLLPPVLTSSGGHCSSPTGMHSWFIIEIAFFNSGARNWCKTCSMVPEELSAPQKMGNDTEIEMDPQLFFKITHTSNSFITAHNQISNLCDFINNYQWVLLQRIVCKVVPFSKSSVQENARVKKRK